jgi:hypothetical protein
MTAWQMTGLAMTGGQMTAGLAMTGGQMTGGQIQLVKFS